MRFSQDFIEKVRQANNVVEIISQHTQLKRLGDRYTGLCPFPDHKEKTPSFSVSEDKQLYYCFGCKKSGNIFTFLETHNGMSFREAVEFLARRQSIPIPEEDRPQGKGGPRTDPHEKDILLKINKLAGVFYYQQLQKLPDDHPARQYIAARGLTAEIVEKFRLGAALDGWEGLVSVLTARKVPLKAAETLGLVRQRKASQKPGYFDQFRERILFPIFSPTGDVIGFGGRTYSDGVPKYLNSPETPVFSKGRVLYGLHETGKYIRTEDRAIVVEGYMDLIALYGAEIRNVAAALGTAFTPDHAKLIRRYTNQVTMLFDGDAAGQTAAERALPVLLQAGLLPRGCFLPDGMDPDDYLRAHGPEALKSELENAPELFKLILGRWMLDYRGSSTEKVQIVEKLAPVMASIMSQQLAELYLAEVARLLDVETKWLVRALRESLKSDSFGRGPGPSPVAPAPGPVEAESEGILPQRISLKGAPRDESFLVSLLLNREALLQEVGKQGVIDVLSHEGLRQLLSVALEKYGQKPDEFAKLAASLASQVDTPGIVACSLELIEGMEGPEEQRLMNEYVSGIRKRYFAAQAKLMAKQLREESSPEKLEQFMNIQRDRLSVARNGKDSDQ